MLPQPHRLRQQRDFDRLRREGRAERHPWLILSHAPNQGQPSRFGFVVGRRVGKAVQRNRVKRRLRECVRTLLPRLKPGYDVVMIARVAVVGQTYHDLFEVVTALSRRAGLLLDQPNPTA